MDSRERVALCLEHQQPDRVPIDCWLSKEAWAKLLGRLDLSGREQLLDHFDVDFRYIDGPAYVGPELPRGPDGAWQDHFGVPRRIVHYGSGESAGTYSEVAGFPLADAATVEQVLDYPHWPSPDHFDYAPVREQAARAHDAGRVAVFMGDRLNRCAQLKPAMYLRGVDRILMDLAGAPEIASAIFSRLADFYAEYAARTLEAAGGKIDILFTGDDFGTQEGLFISPAMWRTFLRDGFRRFIDIGHQFGCKVAHHSCGSIAALLDDFVECGLDVLNPLQPGVRGMDYAAIKRGYGERLCFHGAISIQQTLPYGTPEQVRAEVRDRFEKLAGGGGYIFCSAHNIQADTPVENIEALFAACRELGRYD